LRDLLLGIMPYISASIMMQLLTAVIPQLGRLARKDGGRQKIMQLTRYTTVGLCSFPRVFAGAVVSAPGIVSHHAAGDY
jgi:preprotein translocase subunit SecY